MATYDSLGVPVLGFHNPAGSTFYPKGLYTYAIGNTRGRDVLETLGTKKGQHLDLLLLASGDVRHLLFTISELSLRKPAYQPNSIGFHINDYDPSVVARNVVILELVDTINPDVADDIDFLWNVWYNMTLSKAHIDRLREVLTSLIERNFDGDKSFLKFQASGNVLQECRDIWIDWMELRLNDIHSVKRERNQVMAFSPVASRFRRSLDEMINTLRVNVMSRVMMAPWDLTILDVFSTESSFCQEIEHWFREGSTNDELAAINPTLIRPFVHKWRVHYGACAFEGYLPLHREDLLKSGSFTAACKESLKLFVTQFQHLKRVTSIQVTSWTGDALWLCTSGLPRKLLFDVIDTSNVSDHIGLLNVLVCCGVRLKRPLESQLFTASILWCAFCESIEDYYNKCIGVPPYLLPTVLGLKLAVDFDLGSRKLPDKFNQTEEILCWVKTDTTRTLLKIDENSDIIQAFHRLVEICFNPIGERGSQVYGLTLPSPLTLLRIIQQIHPLIDGGASRILDILYGKLPPDFCQKFGLSWNLINATIGDKKEPIVEVEVSAECSAVPLFGLAADQTPMPMIVIHNQNRDERKSIEKSMVIYNSLRYDVDLHVVKFHLVEEDWKELNETSWLTIETNHGQPLISSNTVVLSGAKLLKVTQVDPVATFGLFSVQTFNVCSPQENHLLEVICVEESEYSYKAELAMRDPSKCQTSNMKINFLPDSCPSAVNINFGKVTGCNMYFSCSIEESSSKFQISRKLGKVTCQIPKRQDGTVGELVLRNPAPISFHALPHWKNGASDAIHACGKMFRTKLDMQLKCQGKDGSPFFDLRESISIIILEHLKQPTIRKVYCVEDHPLINGLYQTSDDILLKEGFIIRVEKVYLWKNLPIAKILFYDCKYYGDIIKSVASPEASRMIASIFQESFACQLHRIRADQKEIDLFRKMLGINAARTTQEHMSNSVWKASFVCPIFPQQGMDDGIDLGEVKCPTTTSTVPRNLFEARSMLSQMFNAPTNPETGINVDTASSSVTLGETECRYCQKKSENLKKCTGCKKVSYCNKDCQRRHWKLEHKTQCKK